MSEKDPQTQPQDARKTDQSAEQLKDSQSSDVTCKKEPLQETGCQPGDQTETFDLPDLGPDWHFNIFLSDLARGLSADELKKIKCLFIDIIGKRVLEQIKIPEELFQTLRERKLISMDNLMLLQRCLYTLQRKDLIEKAVNFATTIGNCLYFYAADTQVNGFKQVKFHVEGKDFTNCTRTYLEEIRTKVSQLLFVPIDSVIVVGVEPSSSMLITFLIPDIYADILESMIERKAHFDDLYRSGIDIIIIGEHKHNIRGVDEVDVENVQQAKLMNVYQQLKKKSEHLEEVEVKLIQQARDIKQLEAQIDKDLKNAVVVRTAERLFHNVVPKDAVSSPTSLETLSALALFVEALKRAEMQKMDRRVIQNLLDANTQVVANRVRDCYATQIEAMLRDIQDLNRKTIPLEMELAKYKFFCPDNLDNIILERKLRFFESLAEAQLVHGISLKPFFREILRNISQELLSGDKEKLLKLFELEQDDEYRRLIDKDQALILECLLRKEIEKRKSLDESLDFIPKCLREIGRTDLGEKYLDLCQHPRQTKSKEKASGGFAKPNSDKAERDRLDQISVDLKNITMKVDRIDATIQLAKDIGGTQKNPYSASFGNPFFFPGHRPAESYSA